jgi:hypothetical protein
VGGGGGGGECGCQRREPNSAKHRRNIRQHGPRSTQCLWS